MGHNTPGTMRANSLRGVAGFCLLLLASCVGLPAQDTFKYATQSEREDALLAAETAGSDDIVSGSDVLGNDTFGGDTQDAQDAPDALDTADAATDAITPDTSDSADGSDALDVVDAADAADTSDASDAADIDTGPDVPPPECVTATNCASKWTTAQLGPCHAAGCVQGVCKQVDKAGPCDDANVCTLGDACVAGACTGTSNLSCTDGDACTADKCDAKSGCYFVAGAGCDDGNVCTADTCDINNACVHLATDATCSDGNACTLGDACTETVCAALDVTVCNDENACTDDSCDPSSGCVFLPNKITCDDGDVCTVGDACGNGGCVPGAKDACTDNNPCTDDACDVASGCLHVNNYVACDDGNKCTPGDTCQGGTCVGLAIAATAFCNDSNVCTDDSCDPTTGCAHANNTVPCDDGLPCTVGDACASGKCASGVSACECKKDADCASKEDGNPCNGTLVCDLSSAPYKCVVSPKTIVVCDASNDTTCAKSTCNLTNGLCGYVAQAEGAACDADGSVCTDKDSCKSGVCTPGAAINCDDGQPCTSDSCDKFAGCQHTNNANACSDGNACTVGDVCGGGSCVPGTKTVCDDGNACTIDTCSASTGNCNFAIQIAAACNDGNACSIGDACDANGLCAGSARNCNDNVVCTSDSCNPASGCVNAPNTIACDDLDACTINDTCGNGVCLGSQVTPTTYCNDSNVCTSDQCSPSIGCTHAPISGPCDDGNNCTTNDTCSNGACVSGSNTCTCTKNADCASQEDGNLCNGTLFCDLSALPYNCKVQPSTIVTCSTVNDTLCAKNTCNSVSGTCSLIAQNENQACNADNSVCTPNDACKTGTCTAAGALSCDDSNPCTNDACDAVNGCTHTANANTCSDGNACTLNDVCSNTQCTSGTPKVCNDSNVCTSDSCNPSSGACLFANNTAVCDDSSLCTINDTCNSGNCVGMAISCDDNNVCTDDLCTAAMGCSNVANTVTCTDNNPCTLADACANKTCQPGAAKNCNDNNPCTNDSCNTGDGTCIHTPNAIACDDGSACTSGDVCAASKCAGTAISCNDNNACTTDSCDGAVGCVFTVSVNCDDKNPCTADSCNKADASCIHDPTANYNLPCDDNNPCTGGDYCGQVYNANGILDPTKSQCYSGWQNGCDDSNTCTNDTCDATGPTCVHAQADPGTACNVCSTVNSIAWTQSGTCSGTTCTLAGSAVSCDDSNVCTKDQCYVAVAGGTGGCTHYGQWNLKCDDGNACTTNDGCTEMGTCSGAPSCDDKNYCTIDSCVDQGGVAKCSYAYANKGDWCDDGDACTSPDSCDATGGCSGLPYTCTDNNVCTVDSCAKATGCSYALAAGIACNTNTDCPVSGSTCMNNTCYVPCDDGNACTIYDNCSSYTCSGTGIVGAITCTAGGTQCGATGTCSNGYCVGVCSDGNLCTLNDTCAGGSCQGTQNTCNDSDPCTDDSCTVATGACAHTAHCDDGNPCTNDSCSGGTCSHSNVGDGLQCGSANFCKTGVCNACLAGTVPTPYDDAGVKQLICAFDYPIWGIRPMNPASYTNNGDSTITDAGTGLTWMYGYMTSQTQSGAMSSCDTISYGNKNDWRLPTVAELQSIDDYLQSASSLNSVFAGSGNRFWAQPAVGSGNGFDVNTVGGATEYVGGTNSFGARCVRGQTTNAALATRYTTSSDSLSVFDNATGLLWHQEDSSTASSTVNAASAQCATYGGTWRLPTLRELESIVDRSNAPVVYVPSPMINAYASNGGHWTSSVSSSTPANNWYVNFTDGTTSSAVNTSSYKYRCVSSCDDGNPCTSDTFDKTTWACKHTATTDGTACGGAGICTSGACVCPAGTYSTTFDDAGTPRFNCIFDYPVWGITTLAPPNQSSNGDGTVSDGKTSLMWQDGKGSASTFNWGQAKSYCDSLILAGKADWRLPSVAELESIVDYTTVPGGPNISSAFAAGTVTTGYWTGRMNMQSTLNTWEVMFSQGLTSYTVATSTYINARCVRGYPSQSAPSARFTNVGGTPAFVKDNATGLNWELASHLSGTTYTQALAGPACVSPNRLPNIRELASIVDRSPASPPAMNSIFTGGSGTFWSGTVMSTSGLSVNFTSGAYGFGGNTNTYYVRCVK